MAGATDPHQSSAGMEALKDRLREEGILEHVALVAAQRGDQLPSLEDRPSSAAAGSGHQVSAIER